MLDTNIHGYRKIPWNNTSMYTKESSQHTFEIRKMTIVTKYGPNLCRTRSQIPNTSACTFMDLNVVAKMNSHTCPMPMSTRNI